jgi:hypothetical protein
VKPLEPWDVGAAGVTAGVFHVTTAVVCMAVHEGYMGLRK